MTDALFLHPDAVLAAPGQRLALTGDEGRHAAVVRRIAAGEMILIADGLGAAVRGPVVEVDKLGLVIEVAEQLRTPAGSVRYVAVQALAKGDRSELAIEMLTELGIEEIIPWQSARAIVRWSGDRAEKSQARWQACAREATKQSRRFRVPLVRPVHSTKQVAALVGQAELALVLHEDAALPLNQVPVPTSGTVMIVIGPEGGITPEELETLSEAGAQTVLISDGVLRTSTAGVVALAGLQLRPGVGA